MISAFTAAFGQLGDPAVRGVIWRTGLWTVCVFLVLGWALWTAISGIDAEITLDFVPFEWLRTSLVWLTGALVAILGGFLFFAVFWLLFAVVAQFVAGFYLERVMTAVERRHFPGLAPAKPPGAGAALAASLRFLTTLAGLNLIALPVYLIPGVGIVAFYGINGYLMGREYFEMVAFRRMNGAAVKALRRSHRGSLLAAGLLVTLILSLPVVNLTAPIVAVAAMVHLFQGFTNTTTMGAAA